MVALMPFKLNFMIQDRKNKHNASNYSTKIKIRKVKRNVIDNTVADTSLNIYNDDKIINFKLQL